VRVAVNKAKWTLPGDVLSPRDIGANITATCPAYVLTVTGGFRLYNRHQHEGAVPHDTYQVADDLTMVRGNISSASAQRAVLDGRLHVYVTRPTATGSSTVPRRVSGWRISSRAA